MEMAKMLSTTFLFKSLFFFWYRFFLRPLKSFRRTNSYVTIATQFKHQRYSSCSLLRRQDLNHHTIFFDVEGALLKSRSVFPYFMLVAFEAGGLIRAIVLILSYPFICLFGDEMGIKIMVMICFFGIKAKSFRVGRTVLPKFLLEDVGGEMFEVVNRCAKKVGISKLPRVMVESFLKEYLEIDLVLGREMKVFCGYFLGLMEDNNISSSLRALELQLQRPKTSCSNVIGVSGFHGYLHHDIISCCKEVYMVSEGDKKSWQKLSKDKYPKPLIFHDGRLALRPTPFETIALLTWVPYAFTLSIIRIITALSLPYSISTPLLALTGLRLTASFSNNNNNNNKNNLYVCNHRTLLDPLYISFSLRRKNLVAVTYSLSRMSELLAPIKTVRLSRKRKEDSRMMKELLREGDLVVCPEGTTCREPYLLRFSPLFSELCDELLPVAIDSHVTMFHGTTAGGLKCMDPIFFLMNPSPSYSLQVLHTISLSTTNPGNYEDAIASDRFQVANRVQHLIANALSFQCTKLTRKDKYLILAGNEGIVSTT